MSLRISVREDLVIEVMATSLDGKRPKHLKSAGIERAMILIEFFVKREYEAAKGQKFIPLAQAEARKAFKELEEKAKQFHASR